MKLKAIETPHTPRRETKPSNLMDPTFKYVPAAATDITQTWRRFGWKPIEQKEKFYKG